MGAAMRGGTRAASERLTRRRLLKYGFVAGAAGFIAPMMEDGNVEDVWAAASHPRRGGSLKIAWAGAPLTLDPAMGVGGDAYMITGAIYDNLTRLDENLVPRPQLAASWKSSPRGDVWTFSLRRGVKFHHGTELTARDVVFTFERILDPKTGSPGRTAFGPLEKVEVVDDYTVRFRLSAPYADLPGALGWPFGRILPADRSSLITSAPSGTGPFRLAEFRPGSFTRMRRFKDYWDHGLPYLDELWQANIPEMTSQVAAVTGGEVQAMFDVPVSFIGALQKSSGVALVELKTPAIQTVAMRQVDKPFDDARVRLAMKYLLNRDAIIRTIWQGRAAIGDDHPVPSFSQFWAPTSPAHTYDVAKAKSLLAEAGHGQGMNLELWTINDRSGMPELAVAVQQMVAPAGIKVEIKGVPISVFLATVEGKKPFHCDLWFGRPTIDTTLYPFFHTGSPLNTGAYSNKELDKWLEDGRSTIDLAKRKIIYAKAEQIIHEDGPWLVPDFINYIYAIRSNVKGQIVTPLRQWDFRQAYLIA